MQEQKRVLNSINLCEEEAEFEHVVVEVVIPFLVDFFKGKWSLERAGKDSSKPLNVQASNSTPHKTAQSRPDKQSREEGIWVKLFSRRPLGSRVGYMRSLSVDTKTSEIGMDEDGANDSRESSLDKDGEVQEGELPSLLKICAEDSVKSKFSKDATGEPLASSIVRNLIKLAGHKKILSWENARVGVHEALLAARSRTLGGGGAGASTLMLPPGSLSSGDIANVILEIEEYKSILESEGVSGDEDDEVRTYEPKMRER